MLHTLSTDPVTKRTVRALRKTSDQLTLSDCVLVHERIKLFSVIATLLENGFEDAAEFLIEHEDLDPRISVDQYALSKLADEDTRHHLSDLIWEYRQTMDDEVD